MMPAMLWCQENVLSDLIQDAKNEGEQFRFYANAFKKVDNKTFINLSDFSHPNEVNIVSPNIEINKIKTKSLSIEIPLANKNVILDLLEVPDSFYDYEVVTDKGERYSGRNSKGKHFRGVIRGDNQSFAAVSFFDNDIIGLIANKDGNYNIGKLSNSDKFIIYNDINLIDLPEFSCGMKNNFEEQIVEEFSQQNNSKNSEDKCIKLYFETMYDIYEQRGSVEEVENYIISVFNQVAIIYLNENINIDISEIKVWTTNKESTYPYYNITDTSTLLSKFKTQVNVLNANLGQLVSSSHLMPYGGIAAGFNGLCNSNSDNSLSVSGSLQYLHTYPNYSRSVEIISHEFGHLLSSRHTHACVWNGNNTAIDGCGSIEGSCPDPGDPPPYEGTIMSYCNPVRLSNGFGIQPGNKIRNYVANASCLDVCDDDCLPTKQIIEPITSPITIQTKYLIRTEAEISDDIDVNFKSKQIFLSPGFKVRGTSLSSFLATVDPCEEDGKPIYNIESNEVRIIEEKTKYPILFPNPASTNVYVKNIEEIISWKLIDVHNQAINKGEVSNKNQIQIEMDISDLYTGIYYFVAKMKNGETYKITIMKR